MAGTPREWKGLPAPETEPGEGSLVNSAQSTGGCSRGPPRAATERARSRTRQLGSGGRMAPGDGALTGSDREAGVRGVGLRPAGSAGSYCLV